MKNMFHALVLAALAVLGIVFTLKCLLGPGSLMSSLVATSGFWLWFGAFAAATSSVVSRFKEPLMALAVHGAAFTVLAMIPRVFPLSLLRLGIDLLQGTVL
jgi:hypothetical protein